MTKLRPAGSVALVFMLASAAFLVGNAQTPATPKYTITDLGTLAGSSSDGRAMNAAGQVTRYADLADGTFHAFRSNGTTMTDLGTLERWFAYVPQQCKCEGGN